MRDSAFQARRAGLLVVDMQRFFLDPKSPAYMEAAREAFPAVRGLVRAFRQAGRPVAFAVYATARGGPMSRWWRKRCPRRSPWTRLGEGLEALPGERIFVKSGYSAFRGTACARHVAARGVSDLVVAGVMTHLCVESTVRDAFDEGLRVFVPREACAAADRRLHAAALSVMAAGFAYVRPERELRAALEAA